MLKHKKQEHRQEKGNQHQNSQRLQYASPKCLFHANKKDFFFFFATYVLNLDSCIPETSSGGSGRFQQDILHFSGWIQPQGVRPLPSIHPAEPDAGAVPHVHVELPQLLVLALADPRGQVCLIALRIRTCRLR